MNPALPVLFSAAFLTMCGWTLFVAVAIWVIPPVVWFLARRLPATQKIPLDTCPVVVVIVPARNEEAAVAQALTSILKSNYPKLHLIAVNDRSTDRTGPLMVEACRNDARATVIHIDHLPEGWLGKNQAMHVAAQQAFEKFPGDEGMLLLFTDGDVIYEAAAISSAVEYLGRKSLDHLCLLPRMIPGSFLENSVVAFFGFAVAIGQQTHLVTTRWPLAYAGVGAFNLIRSDVYRRFEGHRPIAMDVLDDMKLGKLVKQNGGRQDFLGAPDVLSIRWYNSLWQVITGLEKNGYASLSYSRWQLATTTVIFFATMVAPYLLSVLLPGEQAVGFMATVVLWHVMYVITAIGFGGSLLLLPMFPVGAWLMAFAFWRSAWITERQGGIRWRDSFYPLDELRRRILR
ncbi:MAG: glycosyltransferase family 2 protein [Planctomycetaceae bacterium]